MEEKQKKERTIRSETTKVFLVIFAILVVVGGFAIFTSIRGASTFTSVKEVHFTQYRAAEMMKQKALDIVAIYYLLGTDMNVDVLMAEMQRYEGLVKIFNDASTDVEKNFLKEQTATSKKVQTLIKEIKKDFEDLNNQCRTMTFAMMEGKKAEAQAQFPKIVEGIKKFQVKVDSIESLVEANFNNEANQAQSFFKRSTWLVALIIFISIAITVGLIYYLMQFLSISLLPISNLMHNMRQAVFSVDQDHKVVSPASAYSKVVFGDDIVDKNIYDFIYKEVDKQSEAYSANKMALDVVFGADDVQWMLQEDGLIRQVKRTFENDGVKQERILKLTYTPLMEKDLVKNIMIVAEDVTEFEKLRQEAMAQQEEMEIIKGVMGVELSDLENFLGASKAQIEECRKLTKDLQTNLESRQLLFRILHTMKGNSRMYKLNAISGVVHIVEGTVVEINKQVDAGNEISEFQFNTLSEGYKQIDNIVSVHSRMAKKLFGIVDVYSQEQEEILVTALSEVENLADLSVAGHSEKFTTELDSFMKKMKTISNLFEKPSLYEDALELKKKYKSPADFDKAVHIFCEDLIKIAKDNAFFKPVERIPELWVPVVNTIFHAALLFKTEGKSAALTSELNKLIQFSHDLKLTFVSKEAHLLCTYIDMKDTDVSAQIKTHLGHLLSFMLNNLLIDSAYSFNNEDYKSLTTSGNQFEHLRDSSYNALLATFLRSLNRGGHNFETVKETMAFFDIAPVKNFILSPDSKAYFGQYVNRFNEEFFYALSTSDEAGLQKEGLLSVGKESAHRSLYFFDLIRILAYYESNEGKPGFENMEQSLQIPVRSYNEIKLAAAKLYTAGSELPLSQNIKELNDIIRQAIDYPLLSVCRKMETMVFEIGRKLGKDINFKVNGDNVLVPRETAFAIRDALVHMVRNSLDHGIESIDDRLRNGKDQKALLEITLKKNNDHFDIIIRDDGRGINAERIKSKAVENGILTAESAATISDKEAVELIFVPNLSTKEEVTSLSGRGVGMDAVKTSIESLGGKIEIQTKLNIGTSFIISI